MIVGIVGSRGWPAPGRVRSFVKGLAEKYPDAVVVSGGYWGRGCPDWIAEQQALRCGLRVASFRPCPAFCVDLPGFTPRWDDRGWKMPALAEEVLARHEVVMRDEWAVELVELTPESGAWPRVRVMAGRWKSFGQAAFMRDGMVARACDRLVAFHAEESEGTGHTIEAARKAGRPVHVFVPGQMEEVLP